MDVKNAGLSKRAANIFINYRREDSAGHAGRLFDRLGSRFPGRVFMDVDTIEPGIDFGEIIEQAVGCCEVLLVMIGSEWLNVTDAAGRRRLENQNDFVRLEVATALRRNIRVIPVLVKDARMPRPEDLPPDLVSLTRRNAIKLDDARWSFDVDRLIQTIEGVLQERAPSAILPAVPSLPPPPAPETPKPRASSVPGLILVALLGLALAGWALWRLAKPEAPPDQVKESGSSQGPAASPPAVAAQPTPAQDKPAQKTAVRVQKDVSTDAGSKEGWVRRWSRKLSRPLRKAAPGPRSGR